MRNTRTRTLVTLLLSMLVLLSSMGLIFAPSSSNFSFSKHFFSSGGNQAQSTNYALISSIGHTISAGSSSASYFMANGFLSGLISTNQAGDQYETDDNCEQARSIPDSGLIQAHSFHKPSDEDWVMFNATAGTEYLIRADTPITSTADVVLGIFDACSGTLVEDQDSPSLSGVELAFTAPTTGEYYVKLSNNDPAVAGPDVRYDLSIRQLVTELSTNSALIIVAGATKDNDRVQPHIYHVTNQVREMFLNHNYSDETIYYLAPAGTDYEQYSGADGISTLANLEQAITTWAAEKVNGSGALTLYMMDHGSRELLFLDKREKQWVSPSQLDGWLDQLEAKHPGLKVNVIIEACYAGSFISATETTTDTVSSPGRVVMTSTGDRSLAWASPQGGAHFSDRLLAELNRKASLSTSFTKAQESAKIHHPSQTAWLDANGNTIPNEPADREIASERGFGQTGTFPDGLPPTIFQISGPSDLENGQGVLRAEVKDDVGIKHVWATIYPPSYREPTEGEALVRDEDDDSILTLRLTATDDEGWYSVSYDGFDKLGLYRIVFHAENQQSLVSSPKDLTIGSPVDSLFLPLVLH
ncbi:MAG: C13 family peptidase [Chloroflexota bacterium]